MAGAGPLHGYRVLDLAGELAVLAGKMFADLGADVIAVEPPGGSPMRRIPPFLSEPEAAGPEDSCYFQAMAAGKRSAVLDLARPPGRDLLCRLADTADFLIESFPAGHLDALGLSYEVLAARNPRLIYTSVTPFGDRGPGASWRAADIVGWAAGGMMAMMGAPGRPPLQVSVPQAFSHAGSEAAVASMLAHLERERSGRGQHVLISMQAAGVWATNAETAFPVLENRSLARTGFIPAGMRRASVYRCADGYVQLMIGGGMFLSTTLGLLEWRRESGPLPKAVATIDFAAWTPDRYTEPGFQVELAACDAVISDLLLRLPKAEIARRSDDSGWVVAPVATMADVASDRQLAARDFYQRVNHPGLNRDLELVGPFARLSGSPAPPARRAPMLGEHTADVMSADIGLTAKDIRALELAGVVGLAGTAVYR